MGDILTLLKQMFRQYHTPIKGKRQGEMEGEGLSMNAKRLVILLIVIAAGIILGRLAVRAVLNLLLGGTLFGGNVL